MQEDNNEKNRTDCSMPFWLGGCAKERNYSEGTSALIDEEVKRIVDNGYNTAVKILTENMNKLEAVANVLLEKEKIDGDEFELIMKD